MHSPEALVSRSRTTSWGLPGSLLICRHAPSPTTPESPMVALAPYFATGSRLLHVWQLGRSRFILTRPNRFRLRYGSRVRTTRLRSADRSAPRWLGYLLNGQLQGKLLSAYKISQAFPGTPYIQNDVCATRNWFRGRLATQSLAAETRSQASANTCLPSVCLLRDLCAQSGGERA